MPIFRVTEHATYRVEAEDAAAAERIVRDNLTFADPSLVIGVDVTERYVSDEDGNTVCLDCDDPV